MNAINTTDDLSPDTLMSERPGVELLYTPSESQFAASAPDMWTNGWLGIIPQTQDRKPASVYNATLKPGGGRDGMDIANRAPDDKTRQLWLNHCATYNIALYFGATSGHTFAVDIDILDETMSAKVQALADKELGYTTLRREGQFPKLALIYRHAPDIKIANESKRIADQDGTPSEHGVEILAEGKSLTLGGRHHKTGNYFKWLDQNPQNVGPEAAPLVTPEQLKAFMDAVNAAYPFSTKSAVNARGGMSGYSPAASVTAGVKAKDDREAALMYIINHTITSRDPALWVAVRAGDKELAAYRDAKLRIILDKFAAENELSGRWAPNLLFGEVQPRVDHWLGKRLEKGEPTPEEMRAPRAAGEPIVVADPTMWQAHLLVSDKGEPRSLLANALVALEHAPAWQGVLAHDVFADRIMLVKAPPYHTGGEFEPREVRDTDFTWAAQWLQVNRISVSADIAMAAMIAIAHKQAKHPVREYLDNLEWDGEARLDRWLIEHLGAEDTKLTRLYGAKFLLSAVARAFKPGCKVDTLLLLEGRQGLKKSSALRALAGSWFTDHMPDLASKDAPMQLQGVWILEFAELDKLGKADAARAKSFITAQVDRFRRPYGRAAEDFPRQTVFAATINPGGSGYLQDETGNRRYWPVACGATWDEGRQVDVAKLVAARDQLWAEAVMRFANGEAWWLETTSDEDAQADDASARLIEDVWLSNIANFVVSEDSTTVHHVLGDCIGKPSDTWNQADQTRVARALVSLGWERKSVRTPAGREWRYVRGSRAAPKVADKTKERAQAEDARLDAAKAALAARMETEAKLATRSVTAAAEAKAFAIQTRQDAIREQFASLTANSLTQYGNMLEAGHPDLDGLSPLEYGAQNAAACKLVCRWLSDTFAH